MPSIDCETCDSRGYIIDASSHQPVVCPACDGTGTLFIEEGLLNPDTE